MKDLNGLDTKSAANTGYEFEVQNPATLEGTGFMITVLGEDSDEYRRVQREQNQRRLKRAITKKSTDVDVDEIEDDALALLSACTKSWRMKDGGEVQLDDAAYPCTTENARKLYVRMPVVRRQVESAMADRANFLPRSVRN